MHLVWVLQCASAMVEAAPGRFVASLHSVSGPLTGREGRDYAFSGLCVY